MFLVLCTNRSMPHPERDSHTWARCLSNRERQPDLVLSGVSEEEEQQRPHSSLVLHPSRISNSRASIFCSTRLPRCTRSVSDCEDGGKEDEAVWELHPRFPPDEVPSVR